MYYLRRKFFSHIWGQCKSKDIEQFRIHAKKALRMISDEFELAENQKVFIKLKPNFLRELLEERANHRESLLEESFNTLQVLFRDSTKFYNKGFLAWFPSNSSFTGILGSCINNSFTNLETTDNMRAINKSLETRLLDWIKTLCVLPSDYCPLFISNGAGLSTVLSSLAAKRKMLLKHPDKSHLFKYYASEAGHYSQRKSANICGGYAELIKVRFCHKINNYIIDVDHLEEVIHKDISLGKIPTFISVSIGTTASTSYDNISEICDICKKYDIWIHVDAAYSGSSALLPKYDWVLNGIDKADSLIINLAKLLQTLQHSGAFFTKTHNMKFYEVSLAKNEKSSNFQKLTSLEYTTTRFSKGLRIYSFLMSEGFSKTRSVMEHIFMIRSIFEETLKRDSRFEVLFYPSKFGLVCFKLRHKSNDELNSFLKEVLNKVNIMIGPYSLKLSSNELLILRISINSPYITAEEAAILAKKITDVYDSVFN